MRKTTPLGSIVYFSVAALVFSTMTASAQVLDPSRRQEAALARVPTPTLTDSAALDQRSLEEENAFAPVSLGDDDIGEQLILKSVPKEHPLRAFADTFWLWTDNAANVPAGALEDSFYGARIGLGWQQRLTGRTYADFSASQQLVRYMDFDALDFESFEATASVIHIAPDLANTLFFGSLVFNHITGNDFSDDLYQSTSARFGAQKVFLLNRRNSIHLSVLADWGLATDVDQLFRHEYIGDIAWTHKLYRTLVFALNYRFSWMDYQRVDRQDALQFAAATLSWTPKPWLELYTTINFALNDSDVPFFDYETLSAGGGLGARIKF